NQSAVAITDLNHMHGIYQLLKKAPEYNVKPVVGMKVLVDDGLSGAPLILLAKNNEGYQSLIRISAMLSYKDITRTPFEFLQNNANDLVVIAVTDEGTELLGKLIKVSGDDKYISRELGAGSYKKAFIHSARYMRKEDRKALKVLNAIRDNDRLEAHDLTAISGDEYVLKKEDITEEIEKMEAYDMTAIIRDEYELKKEHITEEIDQLLQVNKEIVETCNVSMPEASTSLSHFSHPENTDSDKLLWQQINKRRIEKTDG